MHPVLAQLLPESHDEHLQLLNGLAKLPGPAPLHETSGALDDVDELKGANLLHPDILGPGRGRDLEDALGDVLEPDVLEPALELDLEVGVGAHALANLLEHVAELDEGGVGRQGAVVAAGDWVDGRDLDVASRLDVVEALLDELLPVADANVHVAAVDQVEGVLGKGPVLLGIVNLEVAVWRHPVIYSIVYTGQ
jgi:hypothetical protein